MLDLHNICLFIFFEHLFNFTNMNEIYTNRLSRKISNYNDFNYTFTKHIGLKYLRKNIPTIEN